MASSNMNCSGASHCTADKQTTAKVPGLTAFDITQCCEPLRRNGWAFKSTEMADNHANCRIVFHRGKLECVVFSGSHKSSESSIAIISPVEAAIPVLRAAGWPRFSV